MLSIKGRKEPVITLEYITLDPNQVRTNFVYGLCHEMGHSCMFYTIPKKNKGTTKAYHEGWAHVFGERMAVLLHEKYGDDVWPIQYDYQ